MAGPVVWITRTRPGADSLGRSVARRGFTPLVDPVLSVQPLAMPAIGPEGALAFTSAQAVRQVQAQTQALTLGPDRPVFAVGRATAAAARRAGFTRVISADGDVQALARLIAAHRPDAVHHLAAEDRAGDLQAVLSGLGITAQTHVIYRTVPADFPRARAALAAGQVAVVLVQSPRAAGLIAQAVADGAAPPRAVVQSEACAQPLKGVVADMAVAARPDQAALLACLGTAPGPR